MKKKFLLLGIILCLVLTGCSNTTKEVKDINTFNNSATKYGFTIGVNTDYQKDSHILNSSTATLDDITIEMVIYNNDESANTILENHIKTFQNYKSTGAHEKNEKGSNYHKYFLISNNLYMVSSRVENTLIFTKTPLKNKDKVDAIINELGY